MAPNWLALKLISLSGEWMSLHKKGQISFLWQSLLEHFLMLKFSMIYVLCRFNKYTMFHSFIWTEQWWYMCIFYRTGTSFYDDAPPSNSCQPTSSVCHHGNEPDEPSQHHCKYGGSSTSSESPIQSRDICY